MTFSGALKVMKSGGEVFLWGNAREAHYSIGTKGQFRRYTGYRGWKTMKVIPTWQILSDGWTTVEE